MAASKIAQLPDAVAAQCFSFLDSTSHCACARVCARFRRLALLPAGFPDALRILSPQYASQASPALALMRPRRLLEIAVAEYTEPGLVGRLLAAQTRVRHLVLAEGRNGDRDGDDGDVQRVWLDRACGTSGVENGRDDQLSACQHLEVRVLPRDSGALLSNLLLRLPSLTRLELREFPEPKWRLLCDGAPHLVSLRIAESRRRGPADILGLNDLNFPLRLLTGLTRLRALALPYAAVRLRNLEVASHRLESLEMRTIHVYASPSDPVEIFIRGSERRAKRPAMMLHRLTHLAASVGYYTAASILEATPHVRNGTLIFETNDSVERNRLLVAQLGSAACDTSDANGGDGGDGGGGKKTGGDSVIDAGIDAGTDRERCRANIRVSWRHIARSVARDVDVDMSRIAVQAMSQLWATWSAHDFDESVAADVRREICHRLPVTPLSPRPHATASSSSPSPSSSESAAVA
jgi:hypothetical protein